MNKILATSLTAAVLLAQVLPAHANGSEEFSVATASLVGSVAFGSVLVLSSPFIIVGNLSDAADRNARAVQVNDEQGRTATVNIPKKALDKAQVQPGDRLTVQQRPAGALLLKNEEPVAFIIPPQNAGLSKSTELKR